MSSSCRNVVVIGAGLAGMAAALRIAQAGVSVTLLESRRQLGGRASSFVDPSTGELVDNCQHVSMGCCTYLADFCTRTGIADLLDRVDTLYFQDEQGRVSSMSSSWLAAPAHLLPSFACARFLTISEKLRVAWGLLALLARSSDEPGRPFLDWLQKNGQTPRAIDRFWGLVLVSALNESIDRMDLRYARQVFLEGFLWNKKAFHVEIPRVPLSAFYGPRLEQALRTAGVEVCLNAGVAQVDSLDEIRWRIDLRSGDRINANQVIVAVAPHHVEGLVAPRVRDGDPRFQQMTQLESSPITSVHLWYDRPVMDRPHLVAVGRRIHWLFRRPDDREGYVQAVTSASRELSSWGNEGILTTVRTEIEQMLPAARSAQLRHHRVVTERRATFSVLPGVDRCRPDVARRGSSLYLAGDYVQTGWPATMEGAVRGGYLAARAVLGSERDREPVPSLPIASGAVWAERIMSLLLPTRRAKPVPVGEPQPQPEGVEHASLGRR